MDSSLYEFADKAIQYATKQGVQYCDARAEKQTKKSVLIENGEIEYARDRSDEGIGIKILKNGSWGFYAITNPHSFEEIKEAIQKTIKNVSHYSQKKNNPTKLFPITINKIKKDYPVFKKPQLEDLINVGLECSKTILEKPRIKKSTINPWYTVNSKYFVSSEGSEILQNFTDVVMDMTATAHESGLTQSVDITEGGRGGIDQITKTTKRKTVQTIFQKKLLNFLKLNLQKKKKQPWL